MSSPTSTPTEATRSGRRLLARLVVLAASLLVLTLGVGYMAQPQRASQLLLDRIGKSLGLEITATGPNEYRVRGTPQLVLRNVVAQRPGDPTALLRAERVLVSLPWSTVRARGAELTAQRLELDAPVLDLPALRRWQATRPPSATRIPTLRDGLHVTRGRIHAEGWAIDGIKLALPSLAPGQPLRASLRGRFVDAPTRVPFDLVVALTAPASGAGLTAQGGIDIQGNGWSLPGQLLLSGPLQLGAGDFGVAPARIGFSGRYQSSSSKVPLVLGAAGPLQFAGGVWTMVPANLTLKGEGMIPEARASGAVALGRRLVLRIKGEVARWPGAWPALPPPLSASTSPLDFALDYVGKLDFSDVSDLRLRRDRTSFDTRFRLPEVLAWLDADGSGSPLPPMNGQLRTPLLEIAGAQLEGVEFEIEDPAIPPTPASR